MIIINYIVDAVCWCLSTTSADYGRLLILSLILIVLTAAVFAAIGAIWYAHLYVRWALYYVKNVVLRRNRMRSWRWITEHDVR